jgi:hypothetical protein
MRENDTTRRGMPARFRANIRGNLLARRNQTVAVKSEAARAGIGFGSALAIAISWSVNKSIFWAIVHGILSWFYVIYYALVR